MSSHRTLSPSHARARNSLVSPEYLSLSLSARFFLWWVALRYSVPGSFSLLVL